jgi:hypothetical protein
MPGSRCGTAGPGRIGGQDLLLQHAQPSTRFGAEFGDQNGTGLQVGVQRLTLAARPVQS